MKVAGCLLIASFLLASVHGDLLDDLKEKGYNKLVELIERAELKDSLLGYQPLTLFAPKDDALNGFESKPKDELKEILKYHVIDKTVFPSEMLLSGTTNKLETASGSSLNVVVYKDDIIVANGIRVTKKDIEGVGKYNVVYEVEAVIPVLHPAESILAVLTDSGEFTKLLGAVAAADLVNTLNHNDLSLTVFAPTDEAFAKVPAEAIEDLLKPENKDELQALLSAHVVQNALYAAGIENKKEYQALNETENLKIDISAGGVVVTRTTTGTTAMVTKADLAATNGVVHAIDTVLL